MITDPLHLAVAGVAVVVGGVAAWFHVRRAPALDGERWFKVALSTMLRGAVDATGGERDVWLQALNGVAYHPAGRLPERKVANPSTFRPPGPWLEGERALCEALAAEPDEASRWRLLYLADPASGAALAADPAGLGEAYDPARWLGVDWDGVAAWAHGDERVRDALASRLEARWILVDEPGVAEVPPLLDALASLGLATERLRVDPADAGAAAVSLVDAFEGLTGGWSDRYVVVASGDAAPVVLRALASAPGVRDLVLAVVFVGGNLGGRSGVAGPLGDAEQRAWLEAHLSHADLDTERLRTTTYFHLQWLGSDDRPDGLPGLPLAAQRLPEPRLDSGINRFLEVVDLGPLRGAGGPPIDLVARSLALVVGCWVLSRR